ncbi:hypothetical protein ACM66B_003597 [Microbotryomycetes sp. NB124-2]
MSPPERAAALDWSALSPNEYRDYFELVRAWDAYLCDSDSALRAARPSIAELWAWLQQYTTQQLAKRTQNEILSFFRDENEATRPVHETLLALARLHSHALQLESRLLLRDLIFVATDAVPLDTSKIASALQSRTKKAISPTATANKNPFLARAGPALGHDGVLTPPPSASTSPEDKPTLSSSSTIKAPPPLPPPKRVPSLRASASRATPGSSRALPASSDPSHLLPNHDALRKGATPPLPPRKLSEAIVTPAPPPRKPEQSRLGVSTSVSTRASQSSPVLSASRLTTSTHIGIGQSVRLVPTSTGDSTTHEPQATVSATGRARLSRSNSYLSNPGQAGPILDMKDRRADDDVLGGHAGFTYEPANPSPRRDQRSSADRVQKQQALIDMPSHNQSRRIRARASSSGSSSDLSAMDDDNKADSFSVATDPLPTRHGRFASFAQGETIFPPLQSTTDRATTLNRSRTVGSKPSLPPPPRRRVVSDNPFEAGPEPTSVLKTSVGAAERGKRRDLTADVTSLLVQGAKEGEEWMRRAGEELARRKLSASDVMSSSRLQQRDRRRTGGREERARLVAREDDDEEDGETTEDSTDGRDGSDDAAKRGSKSLIQGVDELDVDDDELQELERRVRRQSEKGQWQALA